MVVAPSLDAGDMVNAFRTQFGVTYPMLPNSRDLAEAFGVSAFPTMFLIGKDGKILWKGHFEEGNFIEVLEGALNGG